MSLYPHITGILWMLDGMALILSNWWLAVYPGLDLISKENISPSKIHIFLFIFTSSSLVSLHRPVMWPSHTDTHTQTHTVPWVRGCQETGHLNQWALIASSPSPFTLSALSLPPLPAPPTSMGSSQLPTIPARDSFPSILHKI